MAYVLWFDELDSTNAEARRRAEAGETGDLWIAARRQTAGRGRRGRVWESPAGNLHATLLTTTDRPPAEAAQLSFVAALAVAQVCDLFATRGLARLKWPNDVMLGDAKVAGILIESGAFPPLRSGGGGPAKLVVGASGGQAVEELTHRVASFPGRLPPGHSPPPPPSAVPLPRFAGEERRLWLAVGIGVNLAAAPEAPERPATAISEHLRAVGMPPIPETALSVLATAFDYWRAGWEAHGFAPVREAWLERAYGLGRPCTARLGAETVEGVAESLDATGALVLRLPDGSTRRIAAGEVFFG